MEFHDNWPLYTTDGKIIADHIIHYEKLAEDLTPALQDLGINWDGWMPRAKGGIRRGSAGPGSYRDLYNAETAAVIARLYAAEIEAHDYSF